MTEHTVTVLMQERYSLDTGWQEATCSVEERAPHQIHTMLLCEVDGPKISMREQQHTHAVLADIERYLHDLVAAGVFSGVVLVIKDDVDVFKQAYGLAHAGYSVPNQFDTKFNVGSINKMFTAVAIAQLVQQGKLHFDDRLSIHLPHFPRAIADRVTLHQLLTHTSGMGNSILNEQTFWTKKDHLRTVADWLALVADIPLEGVPGTRWAYSSRGILVLGAVIEQVSGQSFFEYVRTHILNALEWSIPIFMNLTKMYLTVLWDICIRDWPDRSRCVHDEITCLLA